MAPLHDGAEEPRAGRRRCPWGPSPPPASPAPAFTPASPPPLLVMTLSAVFWLVELWVPLLWLQGKPSFQQGLQFKGPPTPRSAVTTFGIKNAYYSILVGGHSPWAPCSIVTKCRKSSLGGCWVLGLQFLPPSA